MGYTSQQLDEIVSELTQSPPRPYDAFHAAYLCLVKLPLEMNGGEEFGRIKSVLGTLQPRQVSSIIESEDTKALIAIEPPLETLANERHERLATQKMKAEVLSVGDSKQTPTKRLESLAFILKTIRNKREHGFKSTNGPRDTIILRHANAVLREIVLAVLLNAKSGLQRD